jgi:hypothetical protein
MNIELLRRHIQQFIKHPKAEVDNDTQLTRAQRRAYYSKWTAERILQMSREDIHEYLSQLWAMLIWGNKRYAIDKMITDNGLEPLKSALADLVWGPAVVANRWDGFRKTIKGMGPAMISELLVYTHPSECLLWNRRAKMGLSYLGVPNLPTYDYQVNGKRYVELCAVGHEIAAEMNSLGYRGATLLDVDYFLWSELQVEDTLSKVHKPETPAVPAETDKLDKSTADFVHNEVRDKLADIGGWLGLKAQTEVKVADGAVVDTIWEATIGNMGRVIYVFEVQTKGSIDSLVLNLMKSLNNPAVQGVVAVSDKAQLAKIEKEATGLQSLRGKLKCWDYAEVLEVHEALASVNERINGLGLVPQGFGG